MINFHKVGNYYSTLVMLGIGCGYIYSPSTLLEAFQFTTEDVIHPTPACHMAFRAGFTSDFTVGCLGLYSIIRNDPDIRRVAILAFFLDQAVFLWSALPMGTQWMSSNLFPVEVNVLIALLLLIVPESESVSDSAETGLSKKKKDD
jgi:hypothetical protein